MPKASINQFAIYHPHQKDKLGHLTLSLVCVTDNFYFVFNFYNFSITFFFFVNNCRACAIQLSLIVKKRELLKSSSIYTTDIWIERVREAKIPSILLSSTLSKIRLAISKYAIIFELQFVWNSKAFITKPGLITKKEKSLRTLIYYSHYLQTLILFYSSNFASFFLLANYSLFKLTCEKTMKEVKDCNILPIHTILII